MFKTPDTSAPRSLQDVPAFVHAEGVVQDLMTQQAANRAEQRRVQEQLQQIRVMTSKPTGDAAVAEALAAGESWEAATATPAASPLEAQLADIDQREHVLEKAIAIAERRVNDMRREMSKAIYAKRRGDHARRVRTAAAALIAFSRALQAERAFRSGLEDEGLVGIPVTGSIDLDAIGAPDGGGSLANYLRELEAHGFITSAEYSAVRKGEALAP